MRRVYREEGVASFIIYVGIVAVVAMVSLILVLNFFMMVPMKTEDTEVSYYQNGTIIHNLTCTDIDKNGYAYYDIYSNPEYLNVHVMRDGKPASGVWVVMSGCGVDSQVSKTDIHGYAQFDLKDVYLGPGVNTGYLSFKISGKVYHLEVVRG